METGGDDTSDEGYVMVGDDGENSPTKATDTENERKDNGMEVTEVNDTAREPGNPSPQTDVSAGRARHDDMETEPPQPEAAAKHGTGGLYGRTPGPGGDDAERDRRENMRIFLTGRDVDVNWLVYIGSLSESWNVNIVPLTDDSWHRVADITSPHIICHSVRSRTPLSDLERHREYFTHSPVPVKVLVTDVSDPESEKQIRRWMEQHMPKTWELLTLYENEIDSIQPEREKPWRYTNTENNLKRMREILSTAAPSQLHGNKERRTDLRVGIFSRSAEEHYSWLQTLLRSKGFRDRVQEVRACFISCSGYRQFYQDVSQCSFGILYHTKNRGRVNVTDLTDTLYNDELRYLSDTLGRENILVVIDDLDDCGPEMRSRILRTQPSIDTLARDLILFRKEEKSDWEKYLPAIQSLDPRKLQEKLNVIKGWIKPPGGRTHALKEAPTTSSKKSFLNTKGLTDFAANAQQKVQKHRVGIFSSTRHTIGIFSRSAEEDYSWLQTRLRSDGFRDRVQEVRACFISSSGYRQFHQDVSQCSFGILYHSKNRGRVNVTDVTDALYKDELRYLSDTLGRENVVVVIDDLEDCGPGMRSKILQNQPSIRKLAGDLILCDRDKMRNLKTLETLIKAASRRNLVEPEQDPEEPGPSREQDPEEPGPSREQDKQSAQTDQNMEPARLDHNMQSSPSVQSIQSARPDQSMQSDHHGQNIQSDHCGQNIQSDQRGQNIQSDQRGQNIQSDQRGQNIQSDQRGQNIQSDHRGQNIQSDQCGQNIQSDQCGQSMQSDQCGQSMQSDQCGQSIQSDQRGQSMQSDQRGQSMQSDQRGQSMQSDQCGQSMQSDQCGQSMQSDRSKQKDSGLLCKQRNPLDQQKPAECPAQHGKNINGAQDRAQYLDMQNRSLKDKLSTKVHRPSTRHTVGIFSRSAEEHYSWLQTQLRSDRFRDRVQEVRTCFISSSGYRQFYQDVSQCSFGILYHTKNRGRVNVTDVTDALYNDELRYLSDTLGRENVVVVIDDLEDSGSDTRSRILQNQPSIERRARDLILCDRDKMRNLETIECLLSALNTLNLTTKQEVASKDSKYTQKTSTSASSSQYREDPMGSLTRLPLRSGSKRQDRLHGGGDLSDPPRLRPEGSLPLSGNGRQSYPSRQDQERSNKLRKLGQSSYQRDEKAVVSSGQHGGGWSNFFTSPLTPTIKQDPVQTFSSNRHTVGIFSRSAEEDYSWLQTQLRSDGFRDRVREVRACYISSSGYRQFYQDVSQSTFGILYHTKNRGRVNVTDVTDALYDVELRYLSETLGKQRVVVLLDDLEDSWSDQKARILQTQPSIGRLARNLILINQSDKESLISPREVFHEKI